MSDNLYNVTIPVKHVKLNIGYGITHLPVTINHDTGILFSLAEDMGSNYHGDDNSDDLSIDISTLFPKFDDGALSLYIYFLSGLNMSDTYVVDRDIMINCLAIYDYTGDNNFFGALLKCLFKLWTLLSPVLYSSRITDEVKWELWLHSPYQLLPESWQIDVTFMKIWQAREDNKHVVINGSEEFKFEHVTEKTITNDEDDEPYTNLVTVINKVTSYDRLVDNVSVDNIEVKVIEHGQLAGIGIETTYNGKIQGKKIEEDFRNNKRSDSLTVSNTVNGSDNGPYIKYKEGKLQYISYQINGATEGTKVHYYDSGRIKCKTKYNNDLFDGTEIIYFDSPDSKPKFKIQWSNDKKLQQIYYSEDNSDYIVSNYVNHDEVRKLPMSYSFYTSDGTLTREITYPLDQNVDKQDITYDTDGHIISDIDYDGSWLYSLKTNTWEVFETVN